MEEMHSPELEFWFTHFAQFLQQVKHMRISTYCAQCPSHAASQMLVGILSLTSSPPAQEMK